MSSEYIFPAAAADPRFREFFDYWQSKAPPGLLPGRQHIDPLDIPRLLPGIVLLDVVPESGRHRFRFRLVGTTFVETVGTDHTGRFVDEVVLHLVKYEALHEVLMGIVRNKQPHYWETPATMAERDYMSLQRLALPLAQDGRTVDMIVGYYIPVVRPRPAA